ncbi:MAG: hypothetical protein HQM08_01475 [Candidatus Riflebacteria bacterium]|nr:hypothetical protein [Candidatus Riflebacteria bacterium]
MKTSVEKDTGKLPNQGTTSLIPFFASRRKLNFCSENSRNLSLNITFRFLLFLVFLFICPTSFAKITYPPQQQNSSILCESDEQKQSSVVQEKNSPNNKEMIVNLFAPVDAFEKIVLTGVYTNIVGGFSEFKSVCVVRIRQFSQVENRFPEELQILGYMYIKKAKAFNSIVNALKTLRLDSTYKTALLRYYGFLVTLYDQVIQTIRKAKSFSSEDLKRLKMLVKNIEGKAQKYEVTTKFLKIGKTLVKNGTPFAVLKMSSKKALVLVLAEENGEEPVTGWIGLSTLRDRTTWTTESESFFADSLED